MPCAMTPDQLAHYDEHGYVIVRGLFDAEETELLRQAMETDPEIARHAIDREDFEGGATRISLWNRAGDAVYGLAARSARMVDTVEALLGEPVYHYQSKLTAKDPRVGGAWEWHQDYGYWYHNGCLQPRLVSCMIALDSSTRENGCLQILDGSHKMGRLDHIPIQGEDQVGADPERIEEMVKRGAKTIPCELEPGDVLFFHCNTLHRSDQNRSDKRRWTLIYCYNAVSNDTYTNVDDRGYVPLDKVPDAAVKEAGLKLADGRNEEHFATVAYVPGFEDRQKEKAVAGGN